ncbi:MAG: (2Fe-2S)-binding protein [Gammaproteobacteria bacterium]|nr:(2Fe-2S)-binding protein [Gammaproteobacteria bacterium]
MSGPARIGPGLLNDGSQPLAFSFDGRRMRGMAGDTLAAALLANGVRVVGRSFKYHRPRGIVTCGPEEPSALVDVAGPHGRLPNQLATTLPLCENLAAHSQSGWPSLRFDLLALNDRLGRFLPAGFYYKTFMAPGWAWERLYEPAIRRAAGLGRLGAPDAGPHAAHGEMVHAHADVLIVGAGAAGLAAAWTLGRAGVRVILAEQDVRPGGALLLEPGAHDWGARLGAELAGMPNVRLLLRTTVIGAYGQGVFAAREVLASAPHSHERLWVLRAARLVLAAGAQERLIALPGNDVPGVMLAGAALAYLRRYGVLVGRRAACFVSNDAAYGSAFALQEAGADRVAIIDARSESGAADMARARGLAVHAGSLVTAVGGRQAVSAVEVRDPRGRVRWLAADCLLLSGGHSPSIALATQLGAAPLWDEGLLAFTAALEAALGAVVGAAAGVTGLAACARDGAAAGAALAAALGRTVAAELPAGLAEEPGVSAPQALWEVRGRGKAFVDLQNDVTCDDVRLAGREGYAHVEHMKRYTTHGMATDQGRIGGLLGSAVLAAERGVPLAQVGLPRSRPYLQPTPFGTLAGPEVGAHYRPRRRLALHEWHVGAGATFMNAGLWLRPLVYGGPGWGPVLEEARAVRRAVGLTDVSTLGKIDVQGADAARFLDFIYANTVSTLKVGRARYGIMLREDGMMLDDGTTARLAAEHFLLTTTTVNAAAVLEHMEFHLQAYRRRWEVYLSDVTEEWAQFALAGPNSRAVLAALLPDCDLGQEALPFMGVAVRSFQGAPLRLFRISFSGELAYELAVPCRQAEALWAALLAAGAPCGIRPYGLDALNTLRIEKGHVTGAELNGNTSASDLGMQKLLKVSGDFVGAHLARRPAAPPRLQLVGVRPLRAGALRNGMHLVRAADAPASQGYITSSTPCTLAEGWFGLALLEDGHARAGEQLTAVSPVHGEALPVQVVSPHFHDPENQRVRG